MSSLPLTIRAARVDDAAVLAQAERAITATAGLLVSRPNELKDELFAQKIAALAIADNGNYLVAENSGQIVGHAMLDPLPLAAVRHVVHLTLAVHPGWHGRGVGKALLGSLIEWARSTPAVEKIELNVRASNKVAHSLYLKMGFIEIGRWQDRVKIAPGHYIDDVAMELMVK